MPTLYRVLPYLGSARPGEPGHPLFVPPSSGSARVDNPGVYDTLYAGDDPAGAVAEAFGWATTWQSALLRGPPSLPASVRALATYEFAASTVLCDLDDAPRLVQLALRPSQVITRDRGVTQAWALTLFGRGEFAGVRWWSYYDSGWGSFGLWDTATLAVTQVSELTLDHPAVIEAAHVINRIIRP